MSRGKALGLRHTPGAGVNGNGCYRMELVE
jgi:hypothetical protein